VKVVKNKLAPPFREIEFDILYGKGVCRSGDVLDLASDVGIVEKSGAWYSFHGERIGQGRDNARTFLDANPKILDKIEQLVLEKHGIKRGPKTEEPVVNGKDAKDAKTNGADAKKAAPAARN
jgi:recombination protein RecA